MSRAIRWWTPTRRLGVVAVAVALTGTGAMCAGAAAAPRHPTRTVAARGPAALLPPLTSLANFGFPAVTGLSASARIGRAGVDVILPPFTAAAYIYPRHSHESLPGSLRPATPDNEPLHPKPNCDYYYEGLDGDLYATRIDQPDAFRRKDIVPNNGKIVSVGRLPDTKISLLAFGSIPVTAVLHIRQPSGRGRIEPLYLSQISSRRSYSKGYKVVFDDPGQGSGCDAAWDATPGDAGSTEVTGQVEVGVSDVTVDGRGVPVGDRCRASAPLQLHLAGAHTEFGGQFDDLLGKDQVLYQRRTPGRSHDANQTQLYPGSTNLDIPPFTGCRSRSGDDISRLITALAAGPSNTLAVKKGEVAAGDFDPEHPTLCGSVGNNNTTVDTKAGQYCVIRNRPAPLPPAPGK